MKKTFAKFLHVKLHKKGGEKKSSPNCDNSQKLRDQDEGVKVKAVSLIYSFSVSFGAQSSLWLMNWIFGPGRGEKKL